MTLSPLSKALAVALTVGGCMACTAWAQEQVVPSAANSSVRDFNDPNLVYLAGRTVGTAPLAVFLPGTGGRSERAPLLLLDTIRKQGYNVVYLTYDDTPSVSVVCPRQPPACSALFRQERVSGGSGDPAATPPAEAIVQRLADLLRYLDRAHPDQGWGTYLDGNGHPVWSRVLLSGLSQGAGMAAYMAKRFPVGRVVLFSSPWDVTGPDKRPAPWLSGPSATPPDRWWAERHERERTTDLIGHAYSALRIPGDHILLFKGDLPTDAAPGGNNPYHGSTIRLAQYVPEWRVLYGDASAPDGHR